MTNNTEIEALFLDIGGVLLTNGWDRHARDRAVDHFGLDADELQERHHLTFDTYEAGKLSLDEYLDRIVFYNDRSFTKEDFKKFMFAQSKPFDDMIAFIKDVKTRHNLRTYVISNEGRELNDYRINTFELANFIDAFISSSFVHFRKPDEDIYKVAMDVSQVPPQRSVYIDDRHMFVEIARSLGFNGIHHRRLESTKKAMADLGLS
ncbi:MAG TPA: HAD family phosphatase [Balneolales bacterium]|nr:HAD family phosphatase [Balneolales bacterium]